MAQRPQCNPAALCLLNEGGAFSGALVPPERGSRATASIILAGVPQAGRPVFLKIVYHGPRAMEELVAYDPHLVVGVLGGASGTTHDAFALLEQAKKQGVPFVTLSSVEKTGDGILANIADTRNSGRIGEILVGSRGAADQAEDALSAGDRVAELAL